MTDTLTRAEILASRGYEPPPPIEASSKPTDFPEAADPPPVEEPERRCEICDTGIDHRSPRAKVCDSEDCAKELASRRAKRRNAKLKAEREAAAVADQPEPAELEDVVDAEIVELDDDSAEPYADDPLDRIKAAAAAFIHACAAERDVINEARRQITEMLAEVGELLT